MADAPWEVYIELGYWPMFDGFVAIDPSFCPRNWPAAEREFVFRQLMVHELGHMLCLGHSDNPNSVMYAGPYNGVQSVRPDDIAKKYPEIEGVYEFQLGQRTRIIQFYFKDGALRRVATGNTESTKWDPVEGRS